MTPTPFEDHTTPEWLRSSVATVAKKIDALPDWAKAHRSALPPLVVGDHCLHEMQAIAVLAGLRQSTLERRHWIVDDLKKHVAQSHLDAFAWKLFEIWLSYGAPSKEKWALLAVGLLGGDACAIKLTPLLRAWPGEGQHQRAVTGLQCLRAIGTDTALTQLNGIAQKLRFQGLKKKAQELMEAIATDRGLSRADLEDRIVPDLDLDAKGGRRFDFGPRQFQVIIGPDLVPKVRGNDGKTKADLPKPGAKDDPDKAPAAVAAWKLLKKQLRETLKVQAPRLEQAMVVGRRWPLPQFEALLVRHPLMINLVRRLLWGGYDSAAKLVATFRVTEDQTFADVADHAWLPPPEVVSIGIVHPLHLSDEQRSAWGQVFGDYEIIAPFPQLGRPLYAITPEEGTSKVLRRHTDRKVPGMALRGTLEQRGWTRGSAANHGVIMELSKQFPGACVTAVLDIQPGIAMGIPDLLGDHQQVTGAFFLSGMYVPADYPYHKDEQKVLLSQVDPLAMSEVLADLTEVASKGS
jgi:hypothetical protein